MKTKVITAVAALLLMGCMIPLQGCYDVGGPGYGGGYGYPSYASAPVFGPSYVYGYGHPWYHGDDGYWGHGRRWDGHDFAAREGGFHGGHVDFARGGHGGGFAHSGGGHVSGGHAVAHSGGHDGGHPHG